jgi:hypothetical protein
MTDEKPKYITFRKTYNSEKDVKADVKKIFDHHGWWFWMPPANGMGVSNVDFNALRSGVFMAVETKWSGNKPTVGQVVYLRKTVANDGLAFVVDETTLQVFAAYMEAFDLAVAEQQRGADDIDPMNRQMLQVTARQMQEPFAEVDLKSAKERKAENLAKRARRKELRAQVPHDQQ